MSATVSVDIYFPFATKQTKDAIELAIKLAVEQMAIPFGPARCETMVSCNDTTGAWPLPTNAPLPTQFKTKKEGPTT